MKSKYPVNVSEYIANKSNKHWTLEWNEVLGINLVIVIPSICEFQNLKLLLKSLLLNSKSNLNKTLAIFVINNSFSSNQEIKSDNQLSLNYLREIINVNSHDNISQQLLNSGIMIGIVDASSKGKELSDENAGVGLARKIGMDLSLSVFDYSTSNKKIIISLDADCQVEENYLYEIQNYFEQENASVAIIDFEHTLPENEQLNILAYEIFLRHYVVGLLFANSPNAYHSIGSTIVCDHEAYIKVGGMNTKKAGEDFYFLQKLAKHYNIFRITSTKVKPSARESWRVPFGTGRTMADISTDKKEILVYDPEVFIILKKWLLLFESDASLKIDSFVIEANNIHPELFNFLEGRRFISDWQKILSNTKSTKQLNYQRKNWFDAFETLKLIHHLRDTSFPMMEIKSGINKLLKVVQPNRDINLIDRYTELDLLKYYLLELKSLEGNLSKNITK